MGSLGGNRGPLAGVGGLEGVFGFRKVESVNLEMVFGARSGSMAAWVGGLGCVQTELSLTQGRFDFFGRYFCFGLKPSASAWRVMSAMVSAKLGLGLLFSL